MQSTRTYTSPLTYEHFIKHAIAPPARKSLVRQTELTKVTTSARSLVVAAGILLMRLGVGALMRWIVGFGRKEGVCRGKRFI